MKSLQQQFEILLSEMSHCLTTFDIEQITQLVNANELGVAFENFCTQLYEHDAVCSSDQVRQLDLIGKSLGVRPEYWEKF